MNQNKMNQNKMNQNKISNLKRVNFKNKILVISYLIKTVLKLKPSQKEDNFYFLYMHLITSNGTIIDETKEYYEIKFLKNKEFTFRLRKKPSSDVLVFNQIFGYKEYEPVVKTYLENFRINNVVNIIDAGANIGSASMYFIDTFKNVKIVSIEPEKHNFDSLLFNLKNHDSCIKLKAGIWSRDANLKVINDFRDKSDWAFRVIETDDNDGIQSFSINTLQQKFNFEYIDILKIDVEGSEKEIFTSINTDLNFLHKTKVIALEIHDEFNCREDIYKILEEYNFSFFEDQESTIGVNNSLKLKFNE